MTDRRHKWVGNEFEKTCSRCGMIRRKFTGDGGFAVWHPVATAGRWRFGVHLMPPCFPEEPATCT